MDLLPAFLRVAEKDCLVVGGGEVAARKADLLLRAGARVTVVAPELGAALAAMQAAGRVNHIPRAFDDEDLEGMHLAIAATGEEAVNRRVSAAAVRRRLPVNVVDAPALCSFVFPSIVDRSPLLIAVSTGGASPVLARLLRARLEALIPANYGRLAGLLARFRGAVKQRFATVAGRRHFWDEVLNGPVSEMVVAGREDEAAAWIERAVREADETKLRRGEVYVIGAGPGDPDLLTFRALRLLQQADVLLYDRLVAPRILDMARRDAERIYVGKQRSYHSVRQEEINEILVAMARRGKRVARLKGGDPFVFGRGGEEIATLAAEGIPFQIVPGITAANGCAAYAGIPLTHRDYAHSVVFVTGHLKDGAINLEWRSLVQPRQTIVVYMGLTGLEVICRELVRHGMAAAMPAALIEQGTTERQRVVAGTLETLPGIVARAPVHAPTLLIVGEVVKLRETLAWYGATPHERA